MWELAVVCCLLAGPGPAEPAAPILSRIDLPASPYRLAIAPDGSRAALVVLGRGSRSELRLYGPDDAGPLSLPGRVTDLAFEPIDGKLFVLARRPSRREATLYRVDPVAPDTRSTSSVAPTSLSIAFWPERDLVVLAARDALRSVDRLTMRSGPLYRIPGENQQVTHAGGSRFLVTRDAELLLVDLEDPPGRDSMPLRGSVRADATIVGVELTGVDGGRILLADGAWVDLGLQPLALAGRAVSESIPSERVPAPAPAPELELEPVPAASSEEDRSGLSLAGTVSGAAAARIQSVRVFGPNDLLREAGRARPDGAGRWRVGGLAPGRYRVLLDAGGRHSVVSEPPLHLIDLRPDEPSPAAIDFRALGVR